MSDSFWSMWATASMIMYTVYWYLAEADIRAHER
jgi:hypothetical protein